jgi:hypothetical protein
MIPQDYETRQREPSGKLGVPKFSLLSSAAACSGKMRKGKALVAFLIPDFSLQFTRFRWEKPDEEQFFQGTLSQYSHWRAKPAHLGDLAHFR